MADIKEHLRNKLIDKKIHELKEYINNIKILLEKMEANKIVYNGEKEKSHRIVARRKNEYSDIIPITLNIEYCDDMLKFIEINEKTKKNKQKNYSNCESKIIKPNNKQRSTSLYPITSDTDIDRLINRFKSEIKHYEGILKILEKNKMKILDIFKNKTFHNKIKIYDSSEKIKNLGYFTEKINYEYCIFFAPPDNDCTLHAIYFNNKFCKIANCYIYVKNTNGDWHLFYGVNDSFNMETTHIKPTMENLIEHYFNNHLIQKTPKYAFIDKLEIMSDSGYYEEQKYDDELALGFINFLKLYLSNFIENIDVEQCCYQDITYENNVNHINKNNIGVKIIIPINKYDIFLFYNKQEYIINNENEKYKIISQIPKNKYSDNTFKYIIYEPIKKIYLYIIEIYNDIKNIIIELIKNYKTTKLTNISFNLHIRDNINIQEIINTDFLNKI